MAKGVLLTAIETGEAKIIKKELQNAGQSDHYHVIIKYNDGRKKSFSNVSRDVNHFIGLNGSFQF